LEQLEDTDDQTGRRCQYTDYAANRAPAYAFDLAEHSGHMIVSPVLAAIAAIQRAVRAHGEGSNDHSRHSSRPQSEAGSEFGFEESPVRRGREPTQPPPLSAHEAARERIQAI